MVDFCSNDYLGFARRNGQLKVLEMVGSGESADKWDA